MKKLKLISILLIPTCFLNADSFYYSEDFQSTATGLRPDNVSYATPSYMQVVDGSGVDRYKDPFGGEGNHSFLVWDEGALTPRATWSNTSGASLPDLEVGFLSFDFYYLARDPDIQGEKNGKVGVYVGAAHATNAVASIRIQSGVVSFKDGDSGYVDADNFSVSYNTAYTFRMEFSDKQYSLFIKEVDETEFIQLTYNVGGVDKAVFDYQDSSMSVNYVQFTTADNAGYYAPFYIDNLEISSVIPELSEIGLLTGIVVLLLLLSRRCFTKNDS